MENEKVAILICTEPGDLECMSQMLVKSIRQFGGVLKDVEIYSMQPRDSGCLSKLTHEVFDEYGVVHECRLLNEKYPDYGLANKVVTCDYFARQLSSDYLLFLDSDQVVFNDLTAVLAEPLADVRIRPVNKKVAGTDGDDKNLAYWQQLYTLCGVKEHGFVRTSTDHQKIWTYYNSGLVLAKRTSGVFERWKENFDKVMDKNLMPDHGLFFVEQSTLSATISSMELTVEELPYSYNYSPHGHLNLSGPYRRLTLDEIHTFHYHKLFKPPNKLNFETAFEGLSGDKLDWLKKEVVACGINPDPFYRQWELDLLAQKEYIVKQMNEQKNQNK